MKHIQTTLLPIIIWGFLLVLNNTVLAQEQGQDNPEELIKLREEKVTDLDIERSEVGRDYDYLTNVRNKKESLFDEEITLGLSERGSGGKSSALDPRENYFRILAGQDYYFLGELDYSQALNAELGDWFTINFAGLSQHNLSTLFSEDTVDNSKKYRFDVAMSYQFAEQGGSGNSYLHTLEGVHTGYNIGLQSFNATNDELFYYHLRFGYKGYYLLPSLALDHFLSIGGGKYYATAIAGFDDSGFIESSYNLELRGRNTPLNGLYGNFAFDFDWLKRGTEQGGSENYRFLLGTGLGYDWEINSSWTLNFYLGHITEIIKTSDDVFVDAFLPIVVLPKIGFTYLYSPQMRFSFEGGLKSETENLWELYEREALYHQEIFPYFHHLAEGKISFGYDNLEVLDGIELEAFALYDYFFEYDRTYYTPNQLKKLVKEENINRAAIGLKMSIQFLSWLSLKQQTIYNINSLANRLFFPLIDTKSKLVFSVTRIHSRFIINYINIIAEIYSQDKEKEWSLSGQRFDLGYEFEYSHIVLQFSVENILNEVNYQVLPGIQEKGLTILGGVKYFF